MKDVLNNMYKNVETTLKMAVFYTHTHTHTLINLAEKIFKLNLKDSEIL